MGDVNLFGSTEGGEGKGEILIKGRGGGDWRKPFNYKCVWFKRGEGRENEKF
jgi:hypothetical protein